MPPYAVYCGVKSYGIIRMDHKISLFVILILCLEILSPKRFAFWSFSGSYSFYDKVSLKIATFGGLNMATQGNKQHNKSKIDQTLHYSGIKRVYAANIATTTKQII